MAELTRGTVFDRPWGRTLAALGLRGLTGQLRLIAADGKTYEMAFSNGAISGAASPIASDAAVRVALTGGLISTTQVAELARKQASQAGRDEIDAIADHLRLGFDQAMRLRRRTIAQRAARSFSVDKGDFIVTDEITLPIVAGSELDIRSVIYIGAKQNLSEARLAAELGLFGTWFRLKPEAFEDLPQFGFSEAERPLIDQLMNGASLGELEAIEGVDGRTVRATLYALCAANACNVEQTRGQATKPPPATMRASNPGIKRSTPTAEPQAPAPLNAPRAHRPSQQPLVAYRPGFRRPGSQPPPNMMQTPVDANRPMGAAGNTMPPPAARHEATTPPTAQGIVQKSDPGFARARSEPGVPRTGSSSHPGIARAGGSNPGVRTTTPTSVPRTPTPTPTPHVATPSATPRTTTPVPASRPATSATPRAPTAPPVQIATATVARTATAPRAGSSTKAPALQVTDVQALIAERASRIEQGADHYTLLGVAPTASPEEIRKAYFNIARQLHPDRLAALGIADEAHVAHRVFAQLNTAFSVLSDPKRRSEYDELLGRGGEAALREDQARAEEMALKILKSEDAYKKGELALKRDDLDTAIAELARAVELNPDEPDFTALHAWAVFCAAADKNTVARQTRATLEKAVQRSPRAINPRFYLGRVHRMLGNDREALELFREVLVDKPHHFEALSEVRAIEARATGPKPGGGLFGRKR